MPFFSFNTFPGNRGNWEVESWTRSTAKKTTLSQSWVKQTFETTRYRFFSCPIFPGMFLNRVWYCIVSWIKWVMFASFLLHAFQATLACFTLSGAPLVFGWATIFNNLNDYNHFAFVNIIFLPFVLNHFVWFRGIAEEETEGEGWTQRPLANRSQPTAR